MSTPPTTPGICPKCNRNPAPRRTNRGPWPICGECREAQRVKFIERQREKRSSGEWDSHRDRDGIRYDKPIKREYTCTYCKRSFVSGRIRFKVPVCSDLECRGKHWAHDAQKILDRTKAAYAKDPLTISRRRLGYWLNARGLSLDWYDAQDKCCGVCGTTNPGGPPSRGDERGKWCIDHDHRCCPYQDGCSKCIRGLVCHPCNLGMGKFKDDSARLRAAADWIDRHRSKHNAA